MGSVLFLFDFISADNDVRQVKGIVHGDKVGVIAGRKQTFVLDSAKLRRGERRHPKGVLFGDAEGDGTFYAVKKRCGTAGQRAVLCPCDAVFHRNFLSAEFIIPVRHAGCPHRIADALETSS